VPEPSRAGVHLRQAVLVCAELEPTVGRLREALGLGEPFSDPGVAHFGLRNAVCALGDDFLEVVAPARPGTAAGRHLERRGEGGYMALFQVDDLEAARARAEALGVRTVWWIDLPDISASHLHPSDLGGTIVSLDRPDPPESWRWGGPAWTGRAGRGAPGRLAGVTIRVAEPETVAERWAQVLGVPPAPVLALDGGQHVAFEAGDEGLARIAVEIPDRRAEALAFGAARVDVAPG
jgi:hypothetical protein